MLALPQKDIFVVPVCVSCPILCIGSASHITSSIDCFALLHCQLPARAASRGGSAWPCSSWVPVTREKTCNLDQRGGELAPCSISSSQRKLTVKLHPRATRYNMIWGTDHFVLGNRRLLMGLSCCCSQQWCSCQGLQLKLLMIIAFGMIQRIASVNQLC